MPFLFDTDAVSEALKKRPAPQYLRWLGELARAEQYTSAIVVGELYRGAFGSAAVARHLENIEALVLPALTVLPYDLHVARVYGQLHADLAGDGKILADADLQIAATAIHHGLDLVTGNVRHFQRVPGLRLSRVLADARAASG